MGQGIITTDNIIGEIVKETGVRLRPNDIFVRKLMDGFAKNSSKLSTEDKQKSAVFATCAELAKCAAAEVDPVKDFDMLTVVFRGGMPSITINIGALPRILRRKGYIYQDMCVAIPAGGHGHFEEQVSNGRRIIVYNQAGDSTPTVNIDNLLNGSIEKFAMRISIGKTPADMIDFFDYIPTSEIIAASNAGEAGIYKYIWTEDRGKRIRVQAKDESGNPIVNTDSCPWRDYTSTMVKKVCIRRLQKMIKETFPDIGTVLENVATDEQQASSEQPVPVETIEEIVAEPTFDFDAPTQEQMEDISAAKSTYMENPNLLLTALENCYKEMPDSEDLRAQKRTELLQKYFVPLFVAKRQTKLREKYPELVGGIAWLWGE